jgi:hypothetical protein
MPGAEAINPIKLNDVEPQAWLADVLRPIANTPQTGVSKIATVKLVD